MYGELNAKDQATIKRWFYAYDGERFNRVCALFVLTAVASITNRRAEHIVQFFDDARDHRQAVGCGARELECYFCRLI